MVNITISLPRDLYDKLTSAKEKFNTSLGELIRKAVEEAYETKKSDSELE